MIYLHLIHLAATAGFCALLWVVQLVVYPQMATVRAEDFKDYHHRHTHAIGWIVAPLFLAEGTCAAVSFWLGWRAEPWGQVASVGLFTANSMLTFLWFVPAHTRLALGKDEPLLRRLVRMNGWRTGLSTLRVVVVLWLVAVSWETAAPFG
ncbi:MAG: hypothetical protein ACNA8L_09475 [Luteolibacter sp.]